ncbi:MAG TPA: phosphoglycerate mutase (2,3-diphosphoglycerate-independent) [Firmicutes bacterium]|nr:phosphoglycerate mutase (2,3-diphosphoglycerate-independent) [Bacillota bacterium]
MLFLWCKRGFCDIILMVNFMKKVLTIVVDGIGLSDDSSENALLLANMPNYREMFENYPHAELEASGEAVGLRVDQAGNAEIGYKTLGAGQVIRQRSSFMNEFVDIDSLATNAGLKSAVEQARRHKSTIHIMGLMSDAGIVSNIHDTLKIIEYLKEQNVKMVVDFIADGKDVEAKSAFSYIEMIQATGVSIASICGRYYAMDESEKWDRIKIYYDLVRNGVGLKIKDISLALKNCYMRNITDEYLPPILVEPNKYLRNNDVIIWTNYSKEGSREILIALSNPDEIDDFEAVKVDNLKLLMMYNVDAKVEGTALLSEEDDRFNNLGKYFNRLGLTQARIALPSNYQNVVVNFNGGVEEKITRCACYQVDVPKSDVVSPMELGMVGLSKQIIKCMEKDTDFIFAGFDQIDAAGHEGNLELSIKALELFDQCLGRILESASMNFYTVMLVSTHGNVEAMKTPEGEIVTLNTTNKVPFLIMDSKVSLRNGSLADVAPTILKYMDIGIPESMKESKILIED